MRPAHVCCLPVECSRVAAAPDKTLVRLRPVIPINPKFLARPRGYPDRFRSLEDDGALLSDVLYLHLCAVQEFMPGVGCHPDVAGTGVRIQIDDRRSVDSENVAAVRGCHGPAPDDGQ